MTEEARLSTNEYSNLAAALYEKRPDVAEISPIISAHVIVEHGFTKELLITVDQLLVEIEHISAVLTNRRTLDELKP